MSDDKPDIDVLRGYLEHARDWMRELADDLDRWSRSAREHAEDIDELLKETR